MRDTLFCSVIVLLVAGNQACGGGDDGGTVSSSDGCDVKAACGGDVKGDWKITGVCYDEAAVLSTAKQVCADAMLTIGTPTVTGEVSYKSDMTFVQGATTVSATASLTLSMMCLRGGTCDLVQQQLNMGGTGEPITCSSAAAGGCTCTWKLTDMSMATGTYTTSANTVTSKDGDATESQDYCVKGSQLVLFPTAQADTADIPVRLVLKRK
jgi:hypothetical protein